MGGRIVHPDDAVVDRVAGRAMSAHERLLWGGVQLEFYAAATRAFQPGSYIF